MSEMVDRVAKALADSLDDGLRWMDYREHAVTAIEAMREPTKEMMRAMFEAMFEEKFDGTTAPMMGAGFDAAIDAALQD